MKKTSSLTSKLYMGLIFLFLYAPIAIMMVFSFNKSSSTYQMSGSRISVATLNLNQEFPLIAAQLSRIIRDHFGVQGIKQG